MKLRHMAGNESIPILWHVGTRFLVGNGLIYEYF